ncbi:MAG: hypothetical protein U0798_15270 [Gemmataceae bacterium]
MSKFTTAEKMEILVLNYLKLKINDAAKQIAREASRREYEEKYGPIWDDSDLVLLKYAR